MSTMDQRPTNSTTRYSLVRSCGRHMERRCTEMRSTVRESIFAPGTRMLATNTITASGQEPEVHRYTTPLMIRSEEHTSELQSQSNLVCRLLLEKKKLEAS